jgi:hypothetical protein
MALFGLSDITFNKGTSPSKGPLAALVGNQFQTSTLKYPLDVGGADKAHYMVFYIKAQTATQFKYTKATDFKASDYAGSGSTVNPISGILSGSGQKLGQEILGKVNSGLAQLNAQTNGALKGLTGALGKAAGGLADSIDNIFSKASLSVGGDSASTSAHIDTSIKAITNKSLLKTTELTTDAIALYMPDTLNYSYTQSYSDLQLGNELGGKVLAAGSSLIDAFKGGEGAMGKAGAVLKSAGTTAGLEGASAIAGAIGGLAGAQTAQLGFQAATGTVRNPMLEMVYSSPGFRSFQFEFTFYPRDEREALEVQRIIERFRFHQAPELVKGAEGFLIPPSEFDIKFYYAGSMNPNIPAIATTVLTQIDVNYTPNGFTAYEVPGETKPALGRTGMPVAIQLMLQFKETTFLTKDDFKSSGRKDKNSTSKTFSADVSTFSNVDAMGNSNGG